MSDQNSLKMDWFYKMFQNFQGGTLAPKAQPLDTLFAGEVIT